MARSGRPSNLRRRLLTAALSVAGHACVVAALFLWQPRPPEPFEAPAISVALIAPQPVIPPPPPEKPKDEQAPAPKTEAPPAPEKPPPPKRLKVRPPRASPPPEVTPLLARAASETTDGESDVSDAELASAAPAGSGSAVAT